MREAHQLTGRLSLVKLLLLGKQVRHRLLQPFDALRQINYTFGSEPEAQVLIPGKPLSIEDVEVSPPKEGEVRIKVL